jgi:hypothetical protein
MTKTTGYGHRVVEKWNGWYELSWKSDYAVGNLRDWRVMRRDTDRAGAERFAKKWNVRIEGRDDA